MTDPASVDTDERLRLFLALRLPAPVLDAVEAWQHTRLGGVRTVPRDQLHVTLAFLGHRPAGELAAVVGELRAAAAEAAADLRLAPSRYRETRSVAMLVLDDLSGGATAFAEDLQARLERLGAYPRAGRPGVPPGPGAPVWQRAGGPVRPPGPGDIASVRPGRFLFPLAP